MDAPKAIEGAAGARRFDADELRTYLTESAQAFRASVNYEAAEAIEGLIAELFQGDR
jgi:hypothetical protein